MTVDENITAARTTVQSVLVTDVAQDTTRVLRKADTLPAKSKATQAHRTWHVQQAPVAYYDCSSTLAGNTPRETELHQSWSIVL